MCSECIRQQGQQKAITAFYRYFQGQPPWQNLALGPLEDQRPDVPHHQPENNGKWQIARQPSTSIHFGFIHERGIKQQF
jgi:hypothetical protein